jgi:Asp-tRNA(Asn)/Glu-tRNA(Gln) amidotransferase A subunit family amidase
LASRPSYHPETFRPLTFFDAAARFRGGDDDPRSYLERCLQVIGQREPVVQAWVLRNERGARAAADASAARWKSGQPLSAIDGMPIGIKDLIETRDMPTQMGCAAYVDNFPKRDSALVQALREAGAVVLGKVVTTELGGSHPGPTTNPFDPRRTPGGSSSGSGAAVAAGMVPVCIGTQVGGSVVRPASFCGNWALKPTFGAINRGERLGSSQGHIGVHANSPVDMWNVAFEMAVRAGGDPGHPGLFGPLEPPQPVPPQQLVLMETSAWTALDAATRDAFEQVLEALARHGIVVVRRGDSPLVEAFERSLGRAGALNADIAAYESRRSLESIVAQHPGKLSRKGMAKLERGRRLSLQDYRRCLQERDDIRRRVAQLAPLGDALISLASPGPAPVFEPDAARPTGDAAFNYPTSLAGLPVVSVPLLAVGGMPVGVQLVGQPHMDARVVGLARWLQQNVPAVAVDATH